MCGGGVDVWFGSGDLVVVGLRSRIQRCIWL